MGKVVKLPQSDSRENLLGLFLFGKKAESLYNRLSDEMLLSFVALKEKSFLQLLLAAGLMNTLAKLAIK